MHITHVPRSFRRGATAVVAVSIAIIASQAALADIVTGTLKPASAKASLVNAKGEVVAELKAGAYQLQLPVGKYKGKCEATKAKELVVIVIIVPISVTIEYGCYV